MHPLLGILIVGQAASGKSSSLMNIRNQDHWLYINTEANKPLPFKNDFKQLSFNDPAKLKEFLIQLGKAQKDPEVFKQMFKTIDHIEGIIIDSVSELMRLYQQKYILNNTDKNKTFEAWARQSEYLRNLVQVILPNICQEKNIPYIMISHGVDVENKMTFETKSVSDIKGDVGKTGLEAYFTLAPYSTLASIEEVEPSQGDLLSINEAERALDIKYVFRVSASKQYCRVRAPIGMFDPTKPFINNDAQLLIDQFNKYYIKENN